MSRTWTTRLPSVDPADDAICPVPGAVAASELEHRFADPVRVARKPGIAKLQYSGSNNFPEAGWRSLVLSSVAVPKFLLPRSALASFGGSS